ncbi:MAG: hypothetical protein ACO3JL_10770, partial [Myxococcota bacterium]
VRGASDLALGVLREEDFCPRDHEEERWFTSFLEAQRCLGEVVCRRLGELPSSAVVSLDDCTGVMVLNGSPGDEHQTLDLSLHDEQLEELTSCVAEDVLVVGRQPEVSTRRLRRLLIVGAGPVSSKREASREHGVSSTLLVPCTDGIVRVLHHTTALTSVRARRPRRARRQAG